VHGVMQVRHTSRLLLVVVDHRIVLDCSTTFLIRSRGWGSVCSRLPAQPACCALPHNSLLNNAAAANSYASYGIRAQCQQHTHNQPTKHQLGVARMHPKHASTSTPCPPFPLML
jgi:hypothetical protein